MIQIKPPTLNALLEDPVYRKMFRTVPKLPETLLFGNPWAVYAQLVDGRWRGKLFPTYRDAWAMVVKIIRDEKYQDVSVVSRRYMIPPPPGATWGWQFEWCSRCRRPTTFASYPSHHALKSLIVVTEDERCYFCGIRRVYTNDVDRENALIAA